MSSQLLDNPPAYRAKEQEASQTQPPLTSGAIPPVQYVVRGMCIILTLSLCFCCKITRIHFNISRKRHHFGS